MLKRFHRPSHATIVAYAALFVALGGVSYAAIKLPSNSVGTKQLKNKAVTLAKISASAQKSLHGAVGPRGVAGPRGVSGSPGQNGDTGQRGATGATGPDSGPAGGSLTGSYPNPTIASGAVTPSDMATVPAARATIGPAGNIPIQTGTQTALFWDGLTFDEGDAFNNASGIQVLQAPIAGIYQIDGGVEWDTDSTGQRFVGIQVGTNCCFAGSWVDATTNITATIQSVSDLLLLNAGDRVTLSVIQNSGGDLSIAETNGTFIAMHWVGP